jgi:hypothetical protein
MQNAILSSYPRVNKGCSTEHLYPTSDYHAPSSSRTFQERVTRASPASRAELQTVPGDFQPRQERRAKPSQEYVRHQHPPLEPTSGNRLGDHLSPSVTRKRSLSPNSSNASLAASSRLQFSKDDWTSARFHDAEKFMPEAALSRQQIRDLESFEQR